MRRLVVGDIHGAYKALMQVLERASFNAQEDMLISVGDYVDGWPQTPEVIEYLIALPHFKGILANHDDWTLAWLTSNEREYMWLAQGGQATLGAYLERADKAMQVRHRDFLASLPAYLEIDDMLFMHGGCIYPDYLARVKDMDPYTIMWDRDLYYQFVNAQSQDIKMSVAPYSKVFIGHTQTTRQLPNHLPFHYCGLWNIDQGAGWNGKLTVMDIDTCEQWQSDLVPTLYPDVKGRG